MALSSFAKFSARKLHLTVLTLAATGTNLEGDAWICGRTTMQLHFAEDEPFVSASNRSDAPTTKIFCTDFVPRACF